jgi:hypothetical protein
MLRRWWHQSVNQSIAWPTAKGKCKQRRAWFDAGAYRLIVFADNGVRVPVPPCDWVNDRLLIEHGKTRPLPIAMWIAQTGERPRGRV